ncbi:MAG: CopG family transcriptional regulator [Acetobacteraceae bacterium]
MRTLIDLPDEALAELSALGRQRRTSRVAVIREAVRLYLTSHRPPPPEAAFGAWGPGEDGLAYQERVRAEW